MHIYIHLLDPLIAYSFNFIHRFIFWGVTQYGFLFSLESWVSWGLWHSIQPLMFRSTWKAISPNCSLSCALSPRACLKSLSGNNWKDDEACQYRSTWQSKDRRKLRHNLGISHTFLGWAMAFRVWTSKRFAWSRRTIHAITRLQSHILHHSAGCREEIQLSLVKLNMFAQSMKIWGGWRCVQVRHQGQRTEPQSRVTWFCGEGLELWWGAIHSEMSREIQGSLFLRILCAFKYIIKYPRTHMYIYR